ncbi:MAG TPA: hypothetical protein VJI52_01450 [Candidatus Nanoarchaeia archaeon]|nr:hypothetical protein [Candidatus Nanoarchaeia archaeon]
MTHDNVSDRIKTYLDSDFVIRRTLFRNILSLRALARYLIEKLDLKDKNMDAVISAIRRYKKTEKDETDRNLKKLFLKIAVKTRSDIVDLRVSKNKRSVESISKLNSIVDIEKGEIIRVIQAEQSITIIIDDKNMEKFYNIFNKNDVISVDKKLVEINLQFTQEAQDIKGIVALVASSLNSEGVNIVEIMSCAPELLIIVKKDDLLRSLSVINNLQIND